MAYQTYTTGAFVCSTRDSNTADRSYLLFTEEAGMLWATARSVREERSRQRYALQDFSRVRVTLVKGKSGWRIGSVEAITNGFSAAPDRDTRHCITKCFLLLRRFVQGEGVYPSIFGDLEALYAVIQNGQTLPVVASDYFALRLLATLGYVAPSSEIPDDQHDWQQAGDPLSAAQKAIIQNAIAESHL